MGRWRHGRPTAEQRLAIAQRRQAVAALLLQHFPTVEIAKSVGLSTKGVLRDIEWLTEGWQREFAGDLQQVRARELAELDGLEQFANFMLVDTRSRRWVEVRLQIKRQRADLLGLNAPARSELTVSLGKEEVRALSREYGVPEDVIIAEARALGDGRSTPAP